RPDLHREHVAVERREVEQGTVERIALQPGGAGLLPILEVLHGPGDATDGLGHPLAGGALAEGTAQRTPLGLVEVRGDRVGLRLRGLHQRRGGSARTSSRRAAASASVASRRARPICPCAARAAVSARSGATPSALSTSAIASAGGVRSTTRR